MTPSGGRYLRCSTAAETGGSICDHTRHQRRDLLDVGQGFALKFLGARQRPLAIAGDRVDLAVVCEVTEWMAQAPLRRGVGREALMKHAHRRFKLRVGEEIGRAS